MADKLIYIPNNDTQNYSFYSLQCLQRLYTQLNIPTNHNSIKIPKAVKQRITKRYFKNLFTSEINSAMSSLFRIQNNKICRCFRLNIFLEQHKNALSQFIFIQKSYFKRVWHCVSACPIPFTGLYHPCLNYSNLK